MNEEADMRVPCAKVEVEVVLPVAKLLRGCRSLGGDRKEAKTKANGKKRRYSAMLGRKFMMFSD
jgi:hypothetical protein